MELNTTTSHATSEAKVTSAYWGYRELTADEISAVAGGDIGDYADGGDRGYGAGPGGGNAGGGGLASNVAGPGLAAVGGMIATAAAGSVIGAVGVGIATIGAAISSVGNQPTGPKSEPVGGNAAALNFSSRPLRLEITELAQLQLPCILHWNLNHFVVLTKVARNHVVILDPAVGERRLKLDEVSRHFTGVALELTPNAEFEATDQRKKVALSALTGKVLGLKRSLFQVFAIALALQLFAIASPLLNQLVVDDAIATYDKDLLTVLVIGFAMLLLIQTLLGLARSWMVMALGMSLSLQWASNVFSHLVRLPVDFLRSGIWAISSRALAR